MLLSFCPFEPVVVEPGGQWWWHVVTVPFLFNLCDTVTVWQVVVNLLKFLKSLIHRSRLKHSTSTFWIDQFMAFNKTSRSIFQYLSPRNGFSYRFQPARTVNQRRSISFNYHKTYTRFSSGGGPQDFRSPWSDPRIKIVTIGGGFGLLYYVSQWVSIYFLVVDSDLSKFGTSADYRPLEVHEHITGIRGRGLSCFLDLTLDKIPNLYRLARYHDKVCVTSYRLPYSLRITHSVAMSDALCLAFCMRRI